MKINLIEKSPNGVALYEITTNKGKPLYGVTCFETHGRINQIVELSDKTKIQKELDKIKQLFSDGTKVGG